MDLKNSKAKILNAGNPYPLFIDERGDISRLDHCNCTPLGILEARCDEPQEIIFRKGEKLILFTDGVIEAKNRVGMDYTKERLVNLLKGNFHHKAEQLRDLIFNDNAAFLEGNPRSDDQTLLVIEAI